MFEVGGTAGLKKAAFFASIDWEKLERKEVDPPERLAVQSEEDLKHFHDEFTQMPLPRSVVEESDENFIARRVESKNFRGFSFIQEDFQLPDRDADEIEKYWNSGDEEGESDSDCASSKAGDEPQVPLEPEKKKRPPRKRNKKNKVAATNANSAATALDTPSDAVDASKTPSKNDNKKTNADTIVPLNVQIDLSNKVKKEKHGVTPVPPDPVVTAEVVHEVGATQKANASSSLPQASGGQPEKVSQRPTPWQTQQPYSLDRSTNQKYVPPPQRRGVGGIVNRGQATATPAWHQQQPGPRQKGWAGQQQQTSQQQTSQKNGWAVARKPQHPSSQGGGGWSTQVGRSQGKQPTSTKSGSTKQAQPEWNTVGAATARGPSPGSWASKIQAKNIGGKAYPATAVPRVTAHNSVRAPPPPSPQTTRQTTLVPPSPSSDWRQHTMSPSPRKGVTPESQWPGLGDFPPPPDLGKPKTALKAVKPTNGAWGKKR